MLIGYLREASVLQFEAQITAITNKKLLELMPRLFRDPSIVLKKRYGGQVA